MGRIGADATVIEAIVGADGHVADGEVLAHDTLPPADQSQ